MEWLRKWWHKLTNPDEHPAPPAHGETLTTPAKPTPTEPPRRRGPPPPNARPPGDLP